MSYCPICVSQLACSRSQTNVTYTSAFSPRLPVRNPRARALTQFGIPEPKCRPSSESQSRSAVYSSLLPGLSSALSFFPAAALLSARIRPPSLASARSSEA